MSDNPDRWWLPGTFGASRRPGPLGFDISGGLYPESPASRVPPGGASSFDPGSYGEGLQPQALADLGRVLVRHEDELRNALPDDQLRSVYDRLLIVVRANYGSPDAGGDARALWGAVRRRLRMCTSWVEADSTSTAVSRQFMAGGPDSQLSPADSLSPFGRDQERQMPQLYSAIAFVHEHAREHLRERWSKAVNGGHQKLLVEEWLRLIEPRIHTRATGTGPEGARQTAPRRRDPAAPVEKKTWVEFQLIDERGKPVPNEPYVVKLPDGEERTGSLSADGTVRFDGIDPGVCQFFFSDIDGREWRQA